MRAARRTVRTFLAAGKPAPPTTVLECIGGEPEEERHGEGVTAKLRWSGRRPTTGEPPARRHGRRARVEAEEHHRVLAELEEWMRSPPFVPRAASGGLSLQA